MHQSIDKYNTNEVMKYKFGCISGKLYNHIDNGLILNGLRYRFIFIQGIKRIKKVKTFEKRKPKTHPPHQ